MDPLIALVNGNRLRPAVAPIGLDYIADVLRAQSLRPLLVDLCFANDTEAALREGLGGGEPALVGVTLRNTDDCYLASGQDFVPELVQLVASVRRHTDAPVVLGGSGYSVAPEAILEVTGADYGIVGDGEIALAALASEILAEKAMFQVPGIVCREGESVRQNPPWRGPVDGLPARQRALLDNERYFREGGQASVETKRGCDRGCIYCADPLGKGRRVRTRTPAQVADEFEVLLAQGIDCFHLADSEFNVPPEHGLAVSQELAERGIGERARWYTYATPAGFGEELAGAMRRAGCVGVNFGADSGDERMLRELGRDFGTAELKATVRACRQAGLVVMYDLLLGGPGETRESAARTVEFMKRVAPDRVGVSLGVRIYDGTRLAEMVRAEGPTRSNPNLRGAVDGNERFVMPVFYLSSGLGLDADQFVAELVGGDERFFFPTAEAGTEAYNYSDNERLVEAIKAGHRGAYWDILRRLREAG